MSCLYIGITNENDIVNDTVIADPQFTVTLPNKTESMCYEVHGEAGKYFNLISDTCTSVNALFTAMPDNPRMNRMSVIGIYAVTSSVQHNDCAQIQINLDNCQASLNGRPIDLMDEIDDIRIRKFNNHIWRVTVPNCERLSTVMWVTCDGNALRFRTARGSNLTPTSHGLLGKSLNSTNVVLHIFSIMLTVLPFLPIIAQFWNIPITIVDEANKTYIRIYSPEHPKYRFIPAFEYNLTWDHTPMTCYYVGNSVGGPELSHDLLESVIEGSQSQYVTGSLFETTFDFGMFDDSLCSAETV